MCQTLPAVASAIPYSVLDTIKKHSDISAALPTDRISGASAFRLTKDRARNLKVAQILEGTSLATDSTVNKAIRSLRWCSSTCLVSKSAEGHAEVSGVSKRCRHSLCVRCARIRSQAITKRINRVLDSEAHQEFFSIRDAYFLTLTLKHGGDSRLGVYLKELKGHLSKLKRSKWWIDTFGTKASNEDQGWIQAIECTPGSDSLHIHAHVLVFAPRVGEKAMKIEQGLQTTWLKQTKDSTQVRFDLIRDRSKLRTGGTGSTPERSAVSKAIKEVVKYAVKPTKLSEVDTASNERLAEWVKHSKGANMLNCGGYFRGLGMLRSTPDSELQEDDFEGTAPIPIAVALSSQLQFNIPAYAPLKHVCGRRAPLIVDTIILPSTAVPSPEGIDFERIRSLRLNEDEASEYLKYANCQIWDTFVKRCEANTSQLLIAWAEAEAKRLQHSQTKLQF